jgi:hypothetical protein
MWVSKNFVKKCLTVGGGYVIIDIEEIGFIQSSADFPTLEISWRFFKNKMILWKVI